MAGLLYRGRAFRKGSIAFRGNFERQIPDQMNVGVKVAKKQLLFILFVWTDASHPYLIGLQPFDSGRQKVWSPHDISTTTPRQHHQNKCIDRESNTGPIDYALFPLGNSALATMDFTTNLWFICLFDAHRPL